jgi:flagellar biosynthesis/type III secretory pathway M-ring protein FliF/YscJ
MTTTNWIIIAVVAVLVVLAITFVVRGAALRRRRGQADQIREEVREGDSRLHKREAIAAETEAKARAAQAEAEAKAAEGARLQERAASHRLEADSTREHLDAERERADSLDPRTTRSDGQADAPNVRADGS